MGNLSAQQQNGMIPGGIPQRASAMNVPTIPQMPPSTVPSATPSPTTPPPNRGAIQVYSQVPMGGNNPAANSYKSAVVNASKSKNKGAGKKPAAKPATSTATPTVTPSTLPEAENTNQAYFTSVGSTARMGVAPPAPKIGGLDPSGQMTASPYKKDQPKRSAFATSPSPTIPPPSSPMSPTGTTAGKTSPAGLTPKSAFSAFAAPKKKNKPKKQQKSMFSALSGLGR